jgi:hypothetical protein
LEAPLIYVIGGKAAVEVFRENERVPLYSRHHLIAFLWRYPIEVLGQPGSLIYAVN